jgi:hypothetical protein
MSLRSFPESSNDFAVSSKHRSFSSRLHASAAALSFSLTLVSDASSPSPPH